MKQFLKFTLASIVGMIVTLGIISIMFFVLISVMIAGFSSKETVVRDNSILKISLNHDVPDRASDNPFQNVDFFSFESRKVLGLNEILKNIEKAKKDDKIKGIYLDLTILPAGFATVEEIRNKLVEFKESGKFIVSYSDIYTQKAYYLASVSDEIYINPQGGFEWKGMVSQILFFKGAMEKLGIEAQVFRYGEFKSAVEPFTENKMSPENREQMQELLNSIWDKMIENISESRDISIKDLNYYADELLVYNAETAYEKGMIDGIKYYDEFLEILKGKAEIANDQKEDNYILSLAKYSNVSVDEIKRSRAKEKIAVIFAEGEIVMGRGRDGNIGGDRIAKTIRNARIDEDIKAVVLRVNSPGGSGLASENIWREVMLTVKEKPVVVSMGNLAASGGYYIACPANYIFAQPNTITGSIGVFGMLPNIEKLMTEKLGITADQVITNKHSDIGNTMRPMSEREKEFIQKQVDDFYEVFVTRVADGRENLSIEDVKKIGEGRVWSGISSVDLGLVDEIGGLNDAVNKAVELAELDEYRIVEYPRKKDFMERLLEDFNMSISQNIMENTIGENYKLFKIMENVKNMEGIQARMYYDIILK